MNEKININGIDYVRADSLTNAQAADLDGMIYCMVRTLSAGVFAGYLAKRDGKEVTLKMARRIWKWAGAATLSQLATEGTSKPNGCKFPAPVNEVLLTEAIEIIPITKKAKSSINEVPEWKE